MTGRLIDADAFKAQLQREIDIYFDENGGGIHTAMEARDEIDYAPTVDAIPVKWLKENYPTNGVYGTESYFRKAHAVEDILKDWEREKEKRKEE